MNTKELVALLLRYYQNIECVNDIYATKTSDSEIYILIINKSLLIAVDPSSSFQHMKRKIDYAL